MYAIRQVDKKLRCKVRCFATAHARVQPFVWMWTILAVARVGDVWQQSLADIG